jgi:hypothetical protein
VDAAARDALITRYENGPRLLTDALMQVPHGAMNFRPGPGKWSAHEVVAHCADSETNAAMRIRYLVGEDGPEIQGYDQDRWAARMDYHQVPIDLAIAQVEVVRRWTAQLLRRLPEEAWARSGTHSEMPGQAYTAQQWLEIYAEHLEKHAGQIERNIAAFEKAKA